MAGEIIPRTALEDKKNEVEKNIGTSLKTGFTEAKNMLFSVAGTPDGKPVGNYNPDAFKSSIESDVIQSMNKDDQIKAQEQQLAEQKAAEQQATEQQSQTAEKQVDNSQKWGDRIDAIKGLIKSTTSENSVQSGVTKDTFSL